MKKIIYNILSFLIPFTLLFTIFYISNIGPLSENSFITNDLRDQYFPLFYYFKDALSNSNLFSYSFTIGLGSPTIGIIAYYLMSPLNLMLIFFSKTDLVTFSYLLVLIKISLSGFTMYYYLSKKYDKSKTLLIFSTIYALSGYMINYYYNTLWLDSLYMLPIVIYGIEKLIDDNKPFTYLVSLCYTIFVSYYIGYMVCIFSVLYFIYYLFLNYSNNKEIIKKSVSTFIISSLIAGLITMVILIPTYLDLKNGFKLTELDTKFLVSSTPLNVLGRLYIGSTNEEMLFTYINPILYITVFALPLVYFYFKTTTKKERILSLLFILIMISAFFIPYINYIWHGFNFPRFLNFRFTFMLIFLLILFSIKGFYKIKEIKTKDIIIYLVIFTILSIALMFKNFEWLSLGNILISLLFTYFYMIIIYLIKNSLFSNIPIKVLSFLVILELIINGYISVSEYKYVTNEIEKDNYNNYSEIFNKYNPKNNDFYRLEKTFYDKLDDNYIYGNYGYTSFISEYNSNAYNFSKRIGFSANANNNSLYNYGANPFINSLFNIKYFITPNYIYISKFDDFYEKKDQYNNLTMTPDYFYKKMYSSATVLENNHPLSLGFIVNDKIKSLDYNNENPAEYQNNIFKSITGINKDIFENITESYDINMKNDIIYMYINVSDLGKKDTCYIEINDNKFADMYHEISKLFLIDNNLLNDKANIKVDCNNDKYSGYDLYKFNYDVYEEGMYILESNLVDIEKFDNSYITGNIDIKDNNVLFTSIVYDEGWKVLVDGNEVETYKLLDTFLGFNIEEGHHKIEFIYNIPGLKTGIILSLLGLSSLIGYIIYRRKHIIL